MPDLRPENLPAFAIEVASRDAGDAPVKVIDNIAFCGLIGGQVALILTADQGRINANGKIESEHVVQARLRFNLDLAKRLRDLLNTEIDLLTVRPGDKAN